VPCMHLSSVQWTASLMISCLKSTVQPHSPAALNPYFFLFSWQALKEEGMLWISAKTKEENQRLWGQFECNLSLLAHTLPVSVSACG
jgi:hypothetical protein